MKPESQQPQTIDQYIALYPADVQVLLEKVRETIREAAPGAEEAIKYQLPTFVLHGNLVHFGAFKRHIGFYPTASGIAKFKNELAAYASSRGSVRFPFDQPIPYRLIATIVRFRANENEAKAQTARGKKH